MNFTKAFAHFLGVVGYLTMTVASDETNPNLNNTTMDPSPDARSPGGNALGACGTALAAATMSTGAACSAAKVACFAVPNNVCCPFAKSVWTSTECCGGNTDRPECC